LAQHEQSNSLSNVGDKGKYEQHFTFCIYLVMYGSSYIIVCVVPLDLSINKELDCSCCAKDVDSQKKKEIGYIVPKYHLAIGKDGMEDNTDPDHTDTRF
jgi:hypothetical protein